MNCICTLPRPYSGRTTRPEAASPAGFSRSRSTGKPLLRPSISSQRCGRQQYGRRESIQRHFSRGGRHAAPAIRRLVNNAPFLNALEIVPGIPGKMRAVRIVARARNYTDQRRPGVGRRPLLQPWLCRAALRAGLQHPGPGDVSGRTLRQLLVTRFQSPKAATPSPCDLRRPGSARDSPAREE